MSAHTPGPWSVETVELHNTRGESLGNVSRIGAGDDREIAVIYEDAEQDANARLIAASPKLLIALRVIASLLTWSEGCNAVPQVRPTKAELSNHLDGAIGLARDAVAEAEGRS